MGRDHKKRIKRRRRKLYLKRQKTKRKAGRKQAK